MPFFSPDVVRRRVTCQTPWIWTITITVVQVEGGYRVKRKRYVSFERSFDVLGNLLKPFTTSLVVRVVIRRPIEESLSVSSDIRRAILLDIPVQSDVRKDITIELEMDANLRREIQTNLELQGEVLREIELELPVTATINLTEAERQIIHTLVMLMDAMEKEENE